MFTLKLCVWLLGIISLSTTVDAQKLSLLKEIKIKQPVSVSADQYNHLFTCDQQGNVLKYDSTGKLLHVYSPQKVAGASLIEAWPTIQIFLFQKDLQRFSLLDRFLADTKQSANFNANEVGFARAATIASDGQVWVFDESDFSLKKLNSSTHKVSLNVPLGLVLLASNYNINYMREYQNLLFINDVQSGILVFDIFGNYKKVLPFSGLTQFGFYQNELYFLDKKAIHFFNLYTLTSRFIQLPSELKFDFVLVFDTQAVLFSNNSLYIYQLHRN
jgi:hypothetical protein